MSAERKRVLEMLAAGKITAEDAERLLDKLEGSASDQTGSKEKTEEGSAAAPKKQRFLRIVVERPGQDRVNVRVPLSFTRTGRIARGSPLEGRREAGRVRDRPLRIRCHEG
jgi:hypothetical protein